MELSRSIVTRPSGGLGRLSRRLAANTTLQVVAAPRRVL